ncbi:2Fe-2S iron-sulfur cluster-binding protein [Noviherbaspirillum galbum]|uniref:2Fe-2S iron-sulfur cluster binding domain-containing protein n=1 Tax=Noviherbaspirillum galbum TaxID=2709383 RepID=A0A6B3SSC8_9BURK|nr:2Fe-2S iron-sulfur cluster binding domain-containing protein [Noviherbaspirillum galbum]NEX63561.1 2Fe-2S iron-sulfur cluster binding domain-containing protein [Noviherbaspirillum galbum]
MDQHFTARFVAGGDPVEITDAVPLLDAALMGGVRFPTSCRNGTCRTCMCRLVQGKVAYRIEWPGLTPEEKADNYILPCVAYAQSDLVLDAPAARRIA